MSCSGFAKKAEVLKAVASEQEQRKDRGRECDGVEKMGKEKAWGMRKKVSLPTIATVQVWKEGSFMA